MKKAIIFIIMIGCTHCMCFAQSTDREQLDRLSAHLWLIKEDARLGRTVSGGVLIGSGVVLGVGGVLITELTPDLDIAPQDRIIYDAIFVGSGALLVTTGVLTLVLPTDYETLPEMFKDMPEDSPENIRKKINQGEIYLEKLAHQAENDRYLSGGILIATGLAELAFYFFVPPENLENTYYLHDVFLYEGILNCGLGLVSFFIKSAPENEYQSYREWKRLRGISKSPDDTQVRFALLPTRQGVTAAIKISY